MKRKEIKKKKHSFSFEFWKSGYDLEIFEIEMLAQAVIYEYNKYGDITIEEFKEICGQDFNDVISQMDEEMDDDE